MQFRKLLITTLLVTSGVAYSDPLQEAISLFEAGESAKSQEMFSAIDHPVARVYSAELLINSDIDEANDIIDEVLDENPNLARAHYIKGRVMGRKASSAFLSALSYAKKSLAGFSKAVELEPENIEFQLGLLRFHTNAPSIAGGDIEIAQKQAEIIKKLDVDAGIKADLEVSRNIRGEQEHIAYMESLLIENPDNARLNYEIGMQAQRLERYEEAFGYFEKSVNIGRDSKSLEYCLASYQFARTAVIAEQASDKARDTMQNYIDSCSIVDNELPSMEWAKFRLANLIELAGEKDLALEHYKNLASSEDQSLQEQLRKKI